MRSVNICRFVVVYLLLSTFAVQDVFADEDEWISIEKKDLCPALHKEAICTDKLINFTDVAKTIRDLGKKDVLSNKQVNTGEDASQCGDPLKKAMCSSDARPLCLEDKTSGDDSAERRVCTEFYATCPILKDRESLDYHDYIEECAAYLRREFSDMTCVSVGVNFKQGVCPRPTKRMPEFYIQVYEAKSEAMKPLIDLLDDANDLLDNVWETGCLKTVRELPCMPIYCSDDNENIVQMKNKRKDCSRAMECVSKATKKLKSLTGDLAEGLVDNLRDAVKDSCETIIEGFEDLLNPSSDTGGVSAAQYSIPLTLLAVLLCLKMF